jgi:hypothetical protein
VFRNSDRSSSAFPNDVKPHGDESKFPFHAAGLYTFDDMHRIIALTLLLFLMALAFACAKESVGGGGSSPSDAYKKLFAAVKSKQTEAIKSNLTKKTHDLAKLQSGRSGTPIERVYENGFTETTFAAELPTIRDERVNGSMGAVEVWNSQKSMWEDLPFINEEGTWKLAVGDAFAGNYKSPGKGRSEIEKEAANLMSPPQNQTPGNNANTFKPRVITVPTPPTGNKK